MLEHKSPKGKFCSKHNLRNLILVHFTADSCVFLKICMKPHLLQSVALYNFRDLFVSSAVVFQQPNFDDTSMMLSVRTDFQENITETFGQVQLLAKIYSFEF